MSSPDIVSEDVILEAKQGDIDAFAQIYNTYYIKVFFMSFQYLKNEDTAKGIVQEVFIKVRRHIKKLEKPKAFDSWLNVITYRECINHTRGKLKFTELREDQQFSNFSENPTNPIMDSGPYHFKMENNDFVRISK